jgi:2,4-dienoyl-CoA reductase-like NADH-dependent reductase (Old Yellow Enzyme family)
MKKLLDKTRLGNLTLKNRFIRAAIGDFTDDGHLDERIFAKYEALARGGVGTIITGFTLVDEAEKLFPITAIYDDLFIEDFRKLTDIVHSQNTNIILQLVYIGSYVMGEIGERVVLGPSAVANLNTQVIPKEMDIREIKAVQEKFAQAALRAQKAGFDGVEIHAAHGFLLNQFITPYFNRRNDMYGGSIENRSRTLLEVYSAIREAVGKDYQVWVKVNSTDGFEGGLTFDDCRHVCTALAGLGANAIEVSGNWFSLSSTEKIYFKEEATVIAKENHVAVIVTGGNRDYGEMEQLLNSTNVGYFGLARPFISEPDLVNRYEKEHTLRTRCISCNECLDPNNGHKCILNDD